MRWITEVGIIFSYISMLFGYYFFDWNPMGILMYYLLDIIMLLMMFIGLKVIDNQKKLSKYEKQQPIQNYFIASFPFIFFNLVIIYFIALPFDEYEYVGIRNLITWREVLSASIVLIVIYTFKAIHLYREKKAIPLFENSFLYKVTALFITNLIGLLVVHSFNITNALYVLIIMTFARVSFEIYFSLHQKSTN